MGYNGGMTQIPVKSGMPLLGNVIPFVRDLLHYPIQLYHELGPVYRMAIPTYNPVFVFDCDALRDIFEKQHRWFKKSPDYTTLKITLGNGLLTNDGPTWKPMRQLIQPVVFDLGIQTFIRITTDHITRWTDSMPLEGTIDLHPSIKRLTLSIATEAFFGSSVDQMGINTPQLVDSLNQLGAAKMRFPRHLIPYWVPTPLHIKLQSIIRKMDGEIDRHLANPAPEPGSLLDVFLNHPGLSNREKRDELITFLIAGYETTANAIMCALALLANHPTIQAQLRDEINAHGLDPATFKSWRHQLPLLFAVIQEALRLYPPAWMMGRQATADLGIGRYDIPKGSNVIVDVYALHRIPDYWSDPNDFKPERFMTPLGDKMMYLPFGGGPRVCIGQQMALIELATIIHAVVRQFDIFPAQSTIRPAPMVTLTPGRPLSITLVRR